MMLSLSNKLVVFAWTMSQRIVEERYNPNPIRTIVCPVG